MPSTSTTPSAGAGTAAFLMILSHAITAVHAWGSAAGSVTGHQATGAMAQQLLSANGKALVARLVDPSFSGSLAGETAAWADVWRSSHSNTAPWHFVDIAAAPPQSCGYNPSDCTGVGCVVSAITQQTQQLLTTSCATSTANTQAIQFLAHFIGDITQPLHACARDLGGNNDKVSFDGTSTNFHAIHDTNILLKRSKNDLTGISTASDYANYLIGAYKANQAKYTSSSFIDLVTTDAAGNLQAAINMAFDSNALDCNQNAFWALYDSLPSGTDLGGTYYDQTKLLLEEQLAKAGFRLAAWVNAIADTCLGVAPSTTPSTTVTPTTTSIKTTTSVKTTTSATPSCSVSTVVTPGNGRAFDNVMIIVLENEDASSVLSDPYMGTTLKNKGYYLSQFYGVAHPSQPNYIAMISGSTYGVTSDANKDLTGQGQTISDLLEANGLTWKAYMENFAGNCDPSAFSSDGTLYARKHNPFMSFYNSDSAKCAKIVPATQLDQDAQTGVLPNYMFYTPNQVNDGHNTDIPTASNWLNGFLEPKLVDPVYARTLFFVVFDESATTSPNQIYGLMVGAGIAGKGKTDSKKYTHYSFLATVEKNFGLGTLGQNDASAAVIPLASSGATTSTTTICFTATPSPSTSTSLSSSTIATSSTTSSSSKPSSTSTSSSSSTSTVTTTSSTSSSAKSSSSSVKSSTSTTSTSSTTKTKTSTTPSPSSLGACSYKGDTFCLNADGTSGAYKYCDGSNYYAYDCSQTNAPGLAYVYGPYCYQYDTYTAGCDN